jgi:hypothetical protein
MKPEPSATQPKIEDAQKTSSDEAIIKDGTVVGRILTAVPVIFLVFIALVIKNGDFRFTEMVLYNNTGGEITTYGSGGPTVVQRNSWVRIPHPLSPGSWIKRYKKGFTVVTVNRRWSYGVVDPPSDYRTRGNYGNEYRYQIEADGVIYLISPDSASPMQNLPPQPSGFPWLPQSS